MQEEHKVWIQIWKWTEKWSRLLRQIEGVYYDTNSRPGGRWEWEPAGLREKSKFKFSHRLRCFYGATHLGFSLPQGIEWGKYLGPRALSGEYEERWSSEHELGSVFCTCILVHHHSSERRQEQVKMGMVALQPQNLWTRWDENLQFIRYYCKQASISAPYLQYPLLNCNTFNQAASYGSQIKLDDAWWLGCLTGLIILIN